MGAVDAAGTTDARDVQTRLADAVAGLNTAFASRVASPFAIAFGEEFHGVTNTYADAVGALFWLESRRLRTAAPFRFRYAAVIGSIDTPLDAAEPHGLLGAGLTKGRDLIRPVGRARQMVSCVTNVPPLDGVMSGVFRAVDGIVSRWRPKDGPLIAAMIDDSSDARIGAAFGKNRSQIWKRRRTLQVDSYAALRDAAIMAAGLADQAVDPS